MTQVTSGLVAAFRAAGIPVVEMSGWQNRGESGAFNIRGIILHHDAMGLHNNNVAEYMSQNGNDGAQLWIKYTGELFILAAGCKWHAGSGNGWGSIPGGQGNAYAVGIETDYSGTGPWAQAMLNTIDNTCRVIVKYHGLNPQRDCCGHKEYAPDRKVDPGNFDCNAWRGRIGGPVTPPTDGEDDWMATQVKSKVNGAMIDVAEMVAYNDLHLNDLLTRVKTLEARIGAFDALSAQAAKLLNLDSTIPTNEGDIALGTVLSILVSRAGKAEQAAGVILGK
jgi:hypothetical protein